MKRSFRDPIPEIYDSARYLDAAISAHIAGEQRITAELFALANNKNVWEWTDSIWGRKSKYVIINKIPSAHPFTKSTARMPSKSEKEALLKRDGFHCRFCGIPVIRPEVRKLIHSLYPDSVPWGRTNATQHAAFQCMWVQYDHVVPHSSGGTNELDNLVITCAACNFGKMEYTLEELGLYDPRDFEPVKSSWDGLERIFQYA
jgi:hypothetical protein